MTQERKNISLSKETCDHIRLQNKRSGFDFSKWVEETYQKTMLDPDKMLAKIEQAEMELAKMRYDYEILKKMAETRVIVLTKNERRWITSELRQRLERSNNNWEAITRVFNDSFGREFNKSEFRTLGLEVLDDPRIRND